MSKKDILNKHKEERTKSETFTRTMGYFRPVSSFNKGKTGEFNERVFFNSPEDCGCSGSCDCEAQPDKE